MTQRITIVIGAFLMLVLAQTALSAGVVATGGNVTNDIPAEAEVEGVWPLF